MPRDHKNSAIHTAYEDSEIQEIYVPERGLLRAVLVNAIADLKRPGDFKRKATEFFLSNEDDYIFSFQSICSYLNIDPTQVLYVVGLKGDGNVEIPALEEVTEPEPDPEPSSD